MNERGLVQLAGGALPEYLELLEAVVNTDSGSFSPDGVNAIVDLLEERFARGPWAVERTSHQPDGSEAQLGDLLVARTSGTGGANVLLVGHTDTVFEAGTAADRPFVLDGSRAFGPGVTDMKGGLLSGLFALELLLGDGFEAFGSITFVCNPDEEINSPFSEAHIAAIARQSDFAFVLEAGRPNGDVVAARKGVGQFVIEVTGRAAHAGVEPEKGRSAILEAAHKVIALHALNDRARELTVNVGLLQGGTRLNVVAERCVLEVDFRAPTSASLLELEDQIARIANGRSVEEVQTTFHGGVAHPPMERNDRTDALVRIAQEESRQMGFEINAVATGGASDANTIASLGVPTLDGLGPVGGDDHSPNAWLDVTSVAPRIALVAALVARCGSSDAHTSG